MSKYFVNFDAYPDIPEKRNNESYLVDSIIIKFNNDNEIIIESVDKSNASNSCTKSIQYPYKRSNHFHELLTQLQGKESIDVPYEICNKILAELHKNGFDDLTKLLPIHIKNILKKLRLLSYYENINNIISILSGIPLPIIDEKTENKLMSMFKQIQVPFEKHRPKNRVSFFSYSYVMYKFFQLLNLYDFIKFLPLSNNKKKYKKLDIIWEKICVELNWDYIPSI